MWQDAMTSKKVHLISRAAACAAVALFALTTLTGCPPKATVRPVNLTSPYPAPKVWAVVPFRNYSGTSLVDSVAMADHLTQQLQQIDGIQVLPVNRVLETMASKEMPEVRTIEDAMTLMQALKADGLLVGSITAWDPYEPPRIGAQLQLYATRNPYTFSQSDIQTRTLTYAATDKLLPGSRRYNQPVASVGNHFDAANGDTEHALKKYAHGRTPADAPAGYRRYLINMNLYAEFVTHELAQRLLDAEWKRLTAQAQYEPAARTP